MLELLQFVFSSVWVFLGTLMLIWTTTFAGVAAATAVLGALSRARAAQTLGRENY